MKGAETQQRMAQADSEGAEVAQLQQQVAELTQVVMQIVAALQPQEQVQE